MSTPRQPSAQPIAVSIRPTATGEPIHPYLYGQFSELLSNWFDQGLWAEMLGDRKFFYPVDSSEQLPRENRRPLNRWRPVGPEQFVAMDTDAPYVGQHIPRIQVQPDAPHGTRQSGLVLRRGKSYSGRVALSGDPDVQVQVTLAWSQGAPNSLSAVRKALYKGGISVVRQGFSPASDCVTLEARMTLDRAWRSGADEMAAGPGVARLRPREEGRETILIARQGFVAACLAMGEFRQEGRDVCRHQSKAVSP